MCKKLYKLSRSILRRIRGDDSEADTELEAVAKNVEEEGAAKNAFVTVKRVSGCLLVCLLSGHFLHKMLVLKSLLSVQSLMSCNAVNPRSRLDASL